MSDGRWSSGRNIGAKKLPTTASDSPASSAGTPFDVNCISDSVWSNILFRACAKNVYGSIPRSCISATSILVLDSETVLTAKDFARWDTFFLFCRDG